MKSFRGSFSSCVQWKEDSGYKKRKKWTKNEGQENPVVFKSSSIYVQEHNMELTSPTMHQREGVNHGQVVQKGFKDFPWEGNSPEGSCVCATANMTVDVCDMTAVQLPKCFQPVLWWESNMTLWWKQSVLQSHAGSKANAASAGFFNWSHTEAKGMYKNKRKDYFCLNKKPLGFHWVCSPWKTFCWEKLSLGLMNFNLSVR